MDLHLLNAEPTDEEREAIDALLGPPDSRWEGGPRADPEEAHVARGGHELRQQRHLLLPALHALQARAGWISEGGLNYVCTRLGVPPADAWGVATFYALLATAPRPRRVLHVCDDIACRTAGALKIIEDLEGSVGKAHHHVEGNGHVTLDPDGATWLRSPCLGLCDHAPAALLTVAGRAPRDALVGELTSESAHALLRPSLEMPAQVRRALPQRGQPSLQLLARVGTVDPTRLDAYRASGGYTALRTAFALGPEGVIREVTESGLVGRGGAAFPTGRKWDAVARQPRRPHYLICNADESEPGTFKDRVLLEEDPFAIIEAMTIAAYATGCDHGYIYLRAEYPLALERLEGALRQARARGLLGQDIMGKGFDFDIEVRRGAGAYICGEETAIFNSIEGNRGEPRNKPPFPVQAGLFGLPTVVNNVETLANVIPILLMGGQAFAASGSGMSTGTKLFCVSGAIAKPGVYEVPFGVTLRELLELAGGVPQRRTLQAVLLGGAAGMFVRPDELDVPLTFEGARAAGVTLGSGVVMAFDDRVDMRDIVTRIAAFFRDESCGQCVPCRVGTVRQEEALVRLTSGRTRGTVDDEIALLGEVGQAMKDASICGLGQTAYSAVESAIHRLGIFRTEQRS
ncbi:MAG TPA: NAD(P)H-dependent oxidoreductase subunit E [Gemmatimonadaceae bacterium]